MTLQAWHARRVVCAALHMHVRPSLARSTRPQFGPEGIQPVIDAAHAACEDGPFKVLMEAAIADAVSKTNCNAARVADAIVMAAIDAGGALPGDLSYTRLTSYEAKRD